MTDIIKAAAAPDTTTLTEAPPVSAITLKQWLAQGQVLLIDVRETEEWDDAYIVGALHRPMSDVEPEDVPHAAGGSRVVIMCQSGKRSAAVARRLMRHGHRDVYNLEGGLNAWLDAGFSVYEQPLAA